MESLMQPEDSVLYEVRVFVDGLYVAGSIFGQRTTWPHVIDLSSQIDKSGNQDSLRFPPFHQEILQQRHWDAGELHGRIRVVIAEGFSRPHRSPPFERVKDIIAFSFQHAPLREVPKLLLTGGVMMANDCPDILEHSNIAWPNAGMWFQLPSNIFKYHSGNGFGDCKEAEDAHAHSPTRHDHRASGTGSSQASSLSLYSSWPYRFFPTPLPHWPSVPREPKWGVPDAPMADPFTEPYVAHRASRRSKSTLEDVSMPDYVGSSSASSRAISSMTGISYEHSKQGSITISNDDEQYNQFIETHSPSKSLASGTYAPTNTPSIPNLGSKPSAAAEARSASYSRSGARTSLLKDSSQARTRNASGSSAKSGPLESIVEVVPRRVYASPGGNIKGKKETKTPESKDDKQENTSGKGTSRANNCQPKALLRSSGSTRPVSSEIKRKRSSGRSNDVDSGTVKDDNLDTVSPSKKISRKDGQDDENFDDFLDASLHIGTSDVPDIE